ncbi:MAG TPA: putative quinol monooxygenase [Croceibacterium sp.]|nr:putative quinol monooxygenase [Croceibacterium sp.]
MRNTSEGHGGNFVIVLNGTVRMPEGALADLQVAARRMVAATLREPGCVRYAFAQDLLDRNLIHITEAWRDQAALDDHFATPHMVEWRAALAEIGMTDRSLRIYQTDEGTQL